MADTAQVVVQANPASVTLGVTVGDDQNGNIQVSATATKSNLSVSATILPVHIGVATNGSTSGNWSSFAHWTPENVLANAAIALSETLNDATADSNPVVLGIEAGKDLVQSFTMGPSNPTQGLTLPITFLAGLILDYQNASGVIQHFDNVDSPSPNYGYQVPVTISVTVPVVFDVELTSGSTTTIDQTGVVVGSLLLDAGSTLFTGISSTSTGISVTGSINNNGTLYVSQTGPVNVSGSISNQSNIYIEGQLSTVGGLSNSGMITVDARTAMLSGPVSNYSGKLNIQSDGSLILTSFVIGGSVSVATGGVLETANGGGIGHATVTAASGAIVQVDESSTLQFARLTGSGTFRGGSVEYGGVYGDSNGTSFFGSALLNVTVSIGATYDDSEGGTALGGTITNNGTLSGTGFFWITGPVTLQGGGQVTLGSGSGYGYISPLGNAVPSTPLTGRAAGADLLINIDNTITGNNGSISVNVINQAKGTIGASLASGYQNLSLGGTVTNQGLIQASRIPSFI